MCELCDETHRGAASHLHGGQHVDVDGVVGEEGAAPDSASPRVVHGQRCDAAHAGGRGYHVMDPRDVGERHDVLRALADVADSHGSGADEVHLARGQLARAELVLERDEPQPVEGSLTACLPVRLSRQKKHGDVSVARRCCVVCASKRQGDVGLRRRREPLVAVQLPIQRKCVAGLRPCLRLCRATDVRAAEALGHPLPRRPELGWVAAREVVIGSASPACLRSGHVPGRRPRHNTLVQDTRSAICHRQRAGEESARRGEQHELHDLEEARLLRAEALASLCVICGRDQTLLGTDVLQAPPRRTRIDLVDALAPGVVRCQRRWVGLTLLTEQKNLFCAALAEGR
eukprot:PhM_4_TR9220/c0_g1_i1/m.20824